MLRIGALDHFERTLDIGEHDSDQFSLALDRPPRAEDALGEMGWGVFVRLLGLERGIREE
ncbi:MAG: hypothetical protein V3U23_00095 [Kiloniellales bacterium]